MKAHIIETVDELGLVLSNPEDIRSGRNYNLYKIMYPAVFENDSIKQHLEAESVFLVDIFPTAEMPVSSMIYDYLKDNGPDGAIEEFGLEPFS
ncbi:MAG: hypothetical protein FWG19_00900, partial [Methanomassiliicoccaceae archaeon]|nr:hypothetical protein [Methanomassiliicoccaceae archaeon]